MRPLFLTFLFLFPHVLFSQLIERNPIPQPIKREAMQSVKLLAHEVMKGNFLYSLDLMYPRWKEATAKKIGGEESLRKRLESVPQQMLDQGITIIDFQVGEPRSGFYVNAEFYQNSKKSPHFTEYLVFVPTTTIYRVIDQNTGIIKRLEAKGYQVAISPVKGKRSWSFIDGANLTVSELRSLFPLLPNKELDLKLPIRSMKEL